MNNCTKYGFNNLIISGSYGGHRRHTTDDGRRTTPWVWHKLPTGELKRPLWILLMVDVQGHSLFFASVCYSGWLQLDVLMNEPKT